MDDFVNSSPVKLSCFATLCHFFAFLSLLLNPKFEIVIPVSKSTKNKIKITNLFFFFLFCFFLPLLSSLSPFSSMQKPRFLFLLLLLWLLLFIFNELFTTMALIGTALSLCEKVGHAATSSPFRFLIFLKIFYLFDCFIYRYSLLHVIRSFLKQHTTNPPICIMLFWHHQYQRVSHSLSILSFFSLFFSFLDSVLIGQECIGPLGKLTN